jgi:ATP-dependent Clp protease ATP-binding subunit ClpA
MTEKGRLKKHIRARMALTGEPYTVARARLLGRPRPQSGNSSQGARMYPFERFTEKAKHVLTLAQEEAERSHHSYIGTEHLLVALLREADGLAAKALEEFGLTVPKAREAIESLLGQHQKITIVQIIPTSRVKKVIEISFEEARGMGHNYVGTEHMLLGVLIEGEGIAAHVLKDFGVTVDKAREVIDRLLAQHDQETGSARALALDDDVKALLDRARSVAAAKGAEAVGLEHLREALG